MIKKMLLGAAMLQIVLLSPVQAADPLSSGQGPWQFRLRGIGVLPSSGGDTTIGGSPEADNAFVPEFDISYFFTPHIAAELILATSPHDLKLKNSTLGDVDLGDSMILPPTLTLQYHFTPDKTFSPYVGAGINYTLPYAEDAAGGTVTQLEADGSFGWALQAGADYWINDNWGLNFDVKKIYVDVDASINNGAITGNVELDPWVVGAGIAYRF
ncbi:MAG: outer membrane beta-barrel protein [Alphaproteobacteria bacterium]|nr:outer membrane beta-barrel protein [Alphaproteobacteria bacterium]